jgi:hypothetical protein
MNKIPYWLKFAVIAGTVSGLVNVIGWATSGIESRLLILTLPFRVIALITFFMLGYDVVGTFPIPHPYGDFILGFLPLFIIGAVVGLIYDKRTLFTRKSRSSSV